VEPVQTGRDVHVDDVTGPEDFVPARDAVTDDVVAARAHRCREALVAELAGLPSEPGGMLADPMIDVGRGNASPQSPGDEGERGGGGSPCSAHPLDLAAAEDLGAHAQRMTGRRPGVQDRFDLGTSAEVGRTACLPVGEPT